MNAFPQNLKPEDAFIPRRFAYGTPRKGKAIRNATISSIHPPSARLQREPSAIVTWGVFTLLVGSLLALMNYQGYFVQAPFLMLYQGMAVLARVFPYICGVANFFSSVVSMLVTVLSFSIKKEKVSHLESATNPPLSVPPLTMEPDDTSSAHLVAR